MATATAKPTASPSPSANNVPKTTFLSSVRQKGRGLPSAIVLHGVPGIGKTSLFGHVQDWLFVPTEIGIDTLIDAGELPELPHLDVIQSWSDAKGVVNELLTTDHGHKGVVFDTFNGLEKHCHQDICTREYNGNWGNKGFANYQQGYDRAIPEWLGFLADLDRLRTEKGMTVVGICHTKILTFKNPVGPDFDRYEPAMHRKTWEVSQAWADVVLFYTFHTVLSEVDESAKKKKGKATGQLRVIHTERDAAWDAKNRYGLPVEISAGTSSKEAWSNFSEAMKEARKRKAK
jgi:hypothetical protein